MGNKIPEGFKFEDNQFKLTIEAHGKPDGETIGATLSAEVKCDSEFAIRVITNFLERDPEMASLFKKALILHAMDELLDRRLQEEED